MNEVYVNSKHLRQLSNRIDSLLGRRPVSHNDVLQVLKSESNYTVAMLLNVSLNTRLPLFSMLPIEDRLEVLDYMSIHTLRSLIQRLSNSDLAILLSKADSAKRLKIMRLIERSRIGDLSGIVDERMANQLQHHSNYANRAVGRIMQPDPPTVLATMTTSEATRYVAKLVPVTETLNNVYMVDHHGGYVGLLPVAHLIGVSGREKISSLPRLDVPRISPTMTQRRVTQLIQEFDAVELPVVENDKLVGRVLIEDIIDIMQSRALEDVQRLAGVGDGEEMLDTPPIISARRRLPWMVLNMVLGFLAVSVIMPFEGLIAQVTALAVLMPIISNMGGNMGIQSLTVGIRSAANVNFDWRLPFYEVRKELVVGFFNGVVLGIMMGLIGLVGWGNPYLGLVVAVAMVINAVVASIVGGVLPMTLKRMNLDPALMSGSLLTTITDFTGFLTFLTLASLLLPYLS